MHGITSGDINQAFIKKGYTVKKHSLQGEISWEYQKEINRIPLSF
jgi:hypothetical protein